MTKEETNNSANLEQPLKPYTSKPKKPQEPMSKQNSYCHKTNPAALQSPHSLVESLDSPAIASLQQTRGVVVDDLDRLPLLGVDRLLVSIENRVVHLVLTLSDRLVKVTTHGAPVASNSQESRVLGADGDAIVRELVDLLEGLDRAALVEDVRV
jgi:hypothetical protein